MEFVDPKLMAWHIPYIDGVLLRVLRDPRWRLEEVLLLFLGPRLRRGEQTTHKRGDHD
jgi:hypothetical protein